MGVKQDILDLQKQINDLKGKTETPFTSAVTTNPFTKLDKLNLEQGSTGSATFRTVQLYSQESSVLDDSHGLYLTYPDNVSTTEIFGPIPIPADYIPNGIIRFKYLWNTDEATNAVEWIFVVRRVREGEDGTTNLYSEGHTEIIPSATASALNVREVPLPTLPLKSDFMYARLGRDGFGDTNDGEVRLYAMWMEYLAYN